MAPSMPLVTALFTAVHANPDESSMLQMPLVNQGLVVDADECRCPGYYEEECTREVAQGCVWSADGSSNGPWCQCLGPDTRPDPPVATLPPLPHCASSTLFHSTADGCEQPLAGYDFVGFGVCREADGGTGTYSQAPRTMVSLDECVSSCNDDNGCTAIEYIEKDGDGGFQGNCEMHDQPMPNVALNHRGLCYSKHDFLPVTLPPQPVRGPCEQYFGDVSGVVTVSDPDVGHTSASSPYCEGNGMTSPCIYMHLAGAANECQSPAPPDGCHRYQKTTYSDCPELDNFDFAARIDTTGAFTTDGVFVACADRVASTEVSCYGPTISAAGAHTITSGQEMTGLVGHAVVIHSWDMSTASYGGERLACGTLSDDGQGGLIASNFVNYPGDRNPGGFNVQGTFTVTPGTADLSQDIAWDLTGVDPRCNDWVSGPGGPHCGLHIHPGMSCDSHELVDSYNGLYRDNWVTPSHSDDGVWQVTPATNFMGSSYSTTSSDIPVSCDCPMEEPVTSHTIFRLTVLSNYGSTTHFQFSAMNLFDQSTEQQGTEMGTMVSFAGASAASVHPGSTRECRSSEGPANAIDNSDAAKWCVELEANSAGQTLFGPAFSLEVTMPEAAIVNAIQFITGNDVHSRDPKQFTLEGSNGNDVWDMLVDHSCSNADQETDRRETTDMYTTESAGC